MSGFPLEPDGAQMRELVDAAMARLVPTVETYGQQPIYDVAGALDAAAALIAPMPEQGQPLDETLSLIFDHATPHSFGTPMPGYLAYIPGGGLFHSAVADLVGDTLNRYTGVWQAAPGQVQLETNVLRWLCDEVGYGKRARGFFTTGGSLANFSALVVARREKLPPDFLRGTVYCSDQVHHSLQKAAMLAGLPADNVRALPCDVRFRLAPEAVEAAIAADRARGLQPFMIVASAGTVNTGAVDPLPALADLAAREGVWLHVDGAYGGFFVLTARGREVLAGIDRADSVTLDPHKGLFLPYGTGCLLVRDGEALTRAHGLHAAYLPERPPAHPGEAEGEGWWDFSELSPELSRPFRGLRVWLPLQLCGVQAFRDALDEKLDLAQWAAEEVAKIPHLRIVAPPELSLFAFRLEPPGTDRDQHDALNRALLAKVAARQRVLLTGTDLDDGFVGRICVLSFRTHRDRMEMALEDLRTAVAELTG
ncbi:MAG TPA: aminotransferase class I/II-fold pyridoxal phosphate-dependent enzyme [Thermoanaerobaculia bacterium]|nr:aminotransferase class I/II-fold pyridoxal phosphate-dependent enzyme [Thermoanaerobaculia bacterium]